MLEEERGAGSTEERPEPVWVVVGDWGGGELGGGSRVETPKAACEALSSEAWGGREPKRKRQLLVTLRSFREAWKGRAAGPGVGRAQQEVSGRPEAAWEAAGTVPVSAGTG